MTLDLDAGLATLLATPEMVAPTDLTPRRIVDLLDAHVVGQHDAKRALAVALRNRMRRRQVADDLQRDITPRNILLIGPTGVGKTELGRRLAAIADAPFLKVEATAFSEVGYVGRNVESMIADLVEEGMRLAERQLAEERQAEIAREVEDRLVDLLHPWPRLKGKWEDQDRPAAVPADESLFGVALIPAEESPEQRYPQDARIREQLRLDLRQGRLETREVVVTIRDYSQAPRWPEILTISPEELEKKARSYRRRRRVPVSDARGILQEQMREKLCDDESVKRRALALVEERGIIFLDEIDKIAEPERGMAQSRISREGVQRDLLPLIEGTTIRTKHGPVRTDHILFIAAGAFHLTRVESLIPELQGRFPVRAHLQPLGVAEFERILTEPQSALTRQYVALLAVDGVSLEFSEDGLCAIAERAVASNRAQQDIGARRLQQLLEQVLEAVAYGAPESGEGTVVLVDAAYVAERLGPMDKVRDAGEYIL